MKTRAWRQRPTAMAPFQRHRVRREKRSKCACYRLVVKTTTCELLVHSLALGSRPQRLACFILAGLAIHPVNFPIRSCHQAPIPALAMPAVHSKWASRILNALVRPGGFPYPTLAIHEHHKSINNHPGHLSRSISTLFPAFFFLDPPPVVSLGLLSTNLSFFPDIRFYNQPSCAWSFAHGRCFSLFPQPNHSPFRSPAGPSIKSTLPSCNIYHIFLPRSESRTILNTGKKKRKKRQDARQYNSFRLCGASRPGRSRHPGYLQRHAPRLVRRLQWQGRRLCRHQGLEYCRRFVLPFALLSERLD